MNTHQAEYRTDIARLGERIAEFKADLSSQYMALKEEAAKRDAEVAKRDAEAAKRDAEFKEIMARQYAEVAKRDAEFKEIIARQESEAARRDAAYKEEAAQRVAEEARRETRTFLRLLGLISLGIISISLVVRWPV